jgi:hypothetical protein
MDRDFYNSKSKHKCIIPIAIEHGNFYMPYDVIATNNKQVLCWGESLNTLHIDDHGIYRVIDKSFLEEVITVC